MDGAQLEHVLEGVHLAGSIGVRRVKDAVPVNADGSHPVTTN